MIPQKLDNLLVASNSITNSFIVAADYRIHSFEWSVVASTGTTFLIDLVLFYLA